LIGENIRGNHGASSWFQKMRGSPSECSFLPFAFAKDMPCRWKFTLKCILKRFLLVIQEGGMMDAGM
jgi:hypothetical protein